MSNPQEESENLAKEALNDACYLIELNGEFHPFALVLQLDGKTRITELYREEGTLFNSIDHMNDLISYLKGHKAEYIAVAVIFEARIRLQDGSVYKEDAIGITVDHKDGFSKVYTFPYKITEEKKVEPGPYTLNEGNNKIFG
jgi:hypothetical protein